MTKQKKDLLLVIGILIIAAAGYLITKQIEKKPAALLEISVDGTVLHSLDLNENTTFLIEGYGGGTNHLIIENGMAYIDEASCPDKVCIHQGLISLNGQMIVCLPNRMVAEIITQEK